MGCLRGRSGAPEIKGYTQEYLDASSPRSQQIREHLEKTGHNSKEAAEIAAHATRDRKEILSPREILEAHRRIAAEFGNQPNAVVRAAHERAHHLQMGINSVQRAREAVTFARDKNFGKTPIALSSGWRRVFRPVISVTAWPMSDARPN